MQLARWAEGERPPALDLFCKAGGASKGLQSSGFRVTGVDIAPQKNYCGDEFFQADALTFPLEGFAFLWASPPCQSGSVVTPKASRANYLNLIPEVRGRFQASGKLYVIENVEGMRRHLQNPLMLCGSMFGLRCQRHRLFEFNFPLTTLLPPCDHSRPPLLVTTAGANSRRIGNFKSVKNAPVAYGIDWMNSKELAEAIPPAFAEFFGRQAMLALQS